MHSRTLTSLFVTASLIAPAAAAEGDAVEACIPLVAAPLQQASVQDARDSWDWVNGRALPEAIHCHFETGCDGMYVEPVRDWPGADEDPMTAALHASADHSTIEGNLISFDGRVELRKGNLSLDAGSARYLRDSRLLTLEQGVVLRQPGMMLSGEVAEIQTDTGLGRIEQARFVSYEAGARAEARRIERPELQRLNLTKATYTQCPPDSEAWRLRASSIDLDYESGRGVARNSRLHLFKVPVFYIPWMDFPVDDRRATGVLWPSLGSNDGGLDIAVPYYINLAPNYDMTLTPRYLEERGNMLESQFRYLNAASYWELGGAYLDSDKQTEEKRWLGAVREYGTIAQRWKTEIDYTRISDNDYFHDLGISSLSVRRSTHLNQLGSVQYLGDHFNSQLKVQQYQTIANVSEPYKRLPQWTFQYLPSTANMHLEPILQLDATQFEHQDSLDAGGTYVTGSRFYGETGVRFPMRWPAGYIVPTLKMRHVRYWLDLDNLASAPTTTTGLSSTELNSFLNGTLNLSSLGPTQVISDPLFLVYSQSVGNDVDSEPETSVGIGSLDMGLFFEREFSRAGHSWLQTLEPRLYYLYAQNREGQSDQPDFDTSAREISYQQLFRDRRFTGYDRLGDADQAAVGLRSRFIDNSAQREVLSLGLGQLFYFQDREVQLLGDPVATETNSEIAGELRYFPSEQAWLSADVLWDSRNNQINQHQLNAHYRAANNSLYNLGYSLQRNKIKNGVTVDSVEQLDASMAIPLGQQWQGFLRWQYDMRGHSSLENLAGFAFENCCWMARVVYQRSVEPDDSSGVTRLNTDEAILFEFQLKGLGGLGNKLTNVLKESIFGYRDND